MKRLVFLTILAFTGFTAFAQQPSNAAIEAAKHDRLMSILAAKNGGNEGNQVTDIMPEQDCISAITVCQSTYFQPNSYSGSGNIGGEINNTFSCLGAGELNAVWYKIMVTDDGYLGFNIIPNDITNDYDWAVFNLTNAQCSDIFNIPTLEVSCNFSGSTHPTATTGPNGAGNPQDEMLIPIYSGEVYYICISNFSSTQSGYVLDFSPSTVSLGACSHIYGSIYLDLDNNCQINPTDLPLPGQIVYMLPGPYYGMSNANGLYFIDIPNGLNGTYQLFTQPLTPAVEQHCPDTPSYLTVQVNNADSLYTGYNFGYIAHDNIPCPALVVSNISTVIRPCCPSTRYITVSNMGSAISTNNQLEVTYMDNYLAPTGFTVAGNAVPYVQNGNVYTISLPDLIVGDHVNIHVTEVTDTAYVGLETCVLVHALPDYNCANNTDWDGSQVRITSICSNNDTVSFTLQNIGAGNMSAPAVFTVYNGTNVAQTGNFQLATAQSIQYSYPANGDIYVMQANQTDNNPFGEQVSGYSNSCGTTFSPTASFNSFYQNYGGMNTDMDCNIITNAVDPNDKAAVPIGLGPQHFISATDVIEYKIRFQNTGTAPADRVVIVDTLDANLDPATIVLGAASHNYTAELSGTGILTFVFKNINLPAEQDDEAGSMGAITFSVKQRWGLPINYSINNKAYIYFDLNQPIITNNVFHNVKDNTSGVNESSKGNILVELFPNPASQNITLKLNALKTGQSYSMQLFTATGALVHEVGNIKTVENTVDVSTLASGLYYYRVLTTDGKTAAGRFVKE